MYTELLENEDYENLFNLIRLYEDKEHTKPIDYKIVSKTGSYHHANSSNEYVLFIRDFSCSFAFASKKINREINKVYRQYMLKKFSITHPEYADKLNAHLLRVNNNCNI